MRRPSPHYRRHCGNAHLSPRQTCVATTIATSHNVDQNGRQQWLGARAPTLGELAGGSAPIGALLKLICEPACSGNSALCSTGAITSVIIPKTRVMKQAIAMPPI